MVLFEFIMFEVKFKKTLCKGSDRLQNVDFSVNGNMNLISFLARTFKRYWGIDSVAFIAQLQNIGCSLLSHMEQANTSFAGPDTAVSALHLL